MPKKYYMLAVLEDGRWTPQFGDYDRSCVEDERDDFRAHGHKAKDLKIVGTSDRQADINAAFTKLNAAIDAAMIAEGRRWAVRGRSEDGTLFLSRLDAEGRNSWSDSSSQAVYMTEEQAKAEAAKPHGAGWLFGVHAFKILP